MTSTDIKAALIIGVVIVSFLILLALWYIIVRVSEKKDWNGGVCKKTGRRWRWFGCDSAGAYGFTDDSDDGNVIWIQFPQYLTRKKNE